MKKSLVFGNKSCIINYAEDIILKAEKKSRGDSMLMRFSVSNFMSFGYRENEKGESVPTEYHLYAGRSEQYKDRVIHFRERKVLKFSSIYGANASGKTNLIKAIDAGRKIVLNTMVEASFQNKFCRNNQSNAGRPTLFEYEFTIEGRCFAYGFTVSLKENRVISEWLYEMKSADEFVIFERAANGEQEYLYYFDEELFQKKESREQFHFFMKDANRIHGTLLLYEIQRRKMQEEDFGVFNQVYDWFKSKLMVIYPETKIGASFFLLGSDNEKVVDILKYLDTGITGYDIRKIKETAFREYFPDEALADRFLRKTDEDNQAEHRRILNLNGILFQMDHDESGERRIVKLMFRHGRDENTYEYGEESDGTKRLIELLNVILDDGKDKVFLIDELDRSLHPQMTIKFVETFLKFSKKSDTQLIITTHESNLMDLSILRRDEIWFAEKENDNCTELYPLEKFKIRYDKVVAKDYLAGRYGAVPVFQDFEYIWGENRDGKIVFKDPEKF